ncbi:LOW protein: exocyst complex component-like protein isoform X2 [Tasmannia lanceolata]
MHSKYLAFLRISEEVIEMEHELIELQKHISAQGILVQDLMSGVCRELEVWNQGNTENQEAEQDLQACEFQDPLPNENKDHKAAFLETVDVLLAEHKMEEALSVLDAEEKSSPELLESGDNLSTEVSSYKVAFLKRKVMLVDQLVEIAEQPSVGIVELKKALSGLLKLGNGPTAHQLLLKAYGSRLQKSIEGFLPSCSIYSETFPATLSQFVFSTISVAAKESTLIFGDVPLYINRLEQWAEFELEAFVHLVKENAPVSDTASALRAASICIQASLSHCSALESQGLKFSMWITVLLRPYIEEVLDMNFRRATKMVFDLVGEDYTELLSPHFESPLSDAASSDIMLTSSGKKFMAIVKDIVEQLTPVAISHFGGTILHRLSQLFDRYIEALIKVLPGPSEDDNLTDQKEDLHFRPESDSQQLALLGTAFTVADELLPMAVSRICNPQSASKELGNGPNENTIISTEFKDWRRQLQHSLDKLRDHFCRQYVLNFIYSREGKTRLDAQIYLDGKEEDLFWDSDPLPSLPFQALFSKLHQLGIIAGDVLVGKEKIQKILLARLTETVVMWLSDEQGFWEVFEDDSARLHPFGLQQLILDMHFIVEIAVCGGYPSRHVHHIASTIITRAIRTFSARGIDPQSALPEDEWFVDTAKTAINKLLYGASGSESSEIDEEHVLIHDEVSDSEDTASTLSTMQSVDSFVSADMGENESPVYFSDPEG